MRNQRQWVGAFKRKRVLVREGAMKASSDETRLKKGRAKRMKEKKQKGQRKKEGRYVRYRREKRKWNSNSLSM